MDTLKLSFFAIIVASQIVHQENLCKHCGQALINKNNSFCCHGCETVYNIINNSGLSDYYNYRAVEGNKEFKPALESNLTYEFYEDPEFLRENVTKLQNDLASINLFVYGVQCTACAWLIEKLPSFCPGIISAELNYATSVCKVVYDSKLCSPKTIAISLSRLGYAPEPYKQSSEDAHRKNQHRLLLLQLGVAGFCAGNTMIIAVSLYQGFFSGISNDFKVFLHWISFALTLPVILFSAQAFFKSAFAALKLRIPHIDLPIALGILAGFFYSLYNVIFGGEVYFDSICMLVFLLLIGRYVQNVAVERAYKGNNIESFLLPSFARIKTNDGQYIERYNKVAVKSDNILVKADEIIPVDGIVLEGLSSVSNAFLTGESTPISVQSGSAVFAGARNLDDQIIIEAECDFNDSRINRILAIVKSQSKNAGSKSSVINKLSGKFVITVILASSLCFALWLYLAGFKTALLNSMSLLIITCPCALGLAAPLVVARTIGTLAREKIFIKSNYFLEQILSCKTIYFDKTGTLTNGDFDIISQDYFTGLDPAQIFKIATAVESTQNHPIKKAFQKLGSDNEPTIFSSIQTHPGQGVSAILMDGTSVEIGSEKFMHQIGAEVGSEVQNIIQNHRTFFLTSIFIAFDKKIVGLYGIGDKLRDGIVELIKYLNLQGIQLKIISGDNSAVVKHVAGQLGIPEENALSELLPERKKTIVENDNSTTVMIGDGANDAPALKAATLSIGVGGSSEVNLLVADCFIGEPDSKKFLKTFTTAKGCHKIIKANILVSLSYNTLGASLAFLGLMNPLLAALLMPVSSLTVIAIAMYAKIESR